MKKFFYYALAAGMFMSGGMMSAQHLNDDINVDCQSVMVKKSPVSIQQTRAAEEPLLQLPQSEERYGWDVSSDNWMLKRTQKIMYNDKYQISDQIYNYYYDNELSDKYHYMNTYYDNGMLKAQTQLWADATSDWMNFLYYEYYYDTFDEALVSERKVFNWDGSWVFNEAGENGGLYLDIVRDDKGRLVSYQQWTSNMKVTPGVGYYYEYQEGSDAPVKMTLKTKKSKTDMTLVDAYVYENIRWIKSTPQLIHANSKVYYVFGEDENNIPESYDVYEIDPETGVRAFDRTIRYIYDEEGRVTHIYALEDGKYHCLTRFFYDQPNGGFTKFFINFKDVNENMEFDEGEEKWLDLGSKQITTNDEYGNISSIEDFDYDETANDYIVSKKSRTWDRTYLEDGTLKEYVYTYIRNGVLKNKEKFVYDDFVEQVPTGIATASDVQLKVGKGYIKAHDGTRYMISDMEGRVYRTGVVSGNVIRMDGMAKGMYVVRVNGNTVKLVL